MAGLADFDGWLERLGLGEYRALFAEHQIDDEVLPYITDTDLRHIGVPLGHRRRLLQAVAARVAETARVVGELPDIAAAPTAERRQITVLFCDLVGSTPLAERFDPEDLRDIMRSYFDRCIEVLESYGGHVARFMGDGVLAYFGYPRAQEDAAERAVLAGCQLTGQIKLLRPRPGVSLQVRVGIATGLVIVGDVLGKGLAQEDAVIGASPALAQRLQTLATPGSVLIAEGTRRLLGRAFNITDYGEHELKGIGGPTKIWRVSAPRLRARRLAAPRAAAGKSAVGREAESHFLLQLWERAVGGQGQLVLLSGVPGIGKSSLVRELRERVRPEPHQTILLQCSPFHTNIALHPVAEHVQRVTGFTGEATREESIKRLGALLAALGLYDTLASVAALLPQTAAAETRATDDPASREQTKQRLLDALVDWLVATSREAPVLLVVEDAHWLDPTSRELLRRCLPRILHERVMLVVAHRPEFDDDLTAEAGGPPLSRLQLGALPPQDIEALIVQVAGRRLPAGLVQQIVSRTDGVPLFVEELTKTVLEAAVAEDDMLGMARPPADIPATLQDSLLARLDRLGRGREVAQIAAAIGREVPHDLLVAVAGLSRGALEVALGELRETGLLHILPDAPRPSYAFSHALVQETAYSTLLHSRRRELHARISWVLEEHFPEVVASQPAVVAHHYTEAGLFAPAVSWWQRAAERSRRQAANVEAMQQYHRALAVVRRMPEAPHRDKLEIELRAELDGALYAAMGPSSAQREANLAELSALHARMGDVARMFPVLWGQCVIIFSRGELPRSMERTHEYLEIAERSGSAHVRAIGHLHLGHTELLRGAIRPGMAHLDRALALYDARDRGRLIAEFGLDLPAFARSCLCLGLQQLGDAAASDAAATSALAEAQSSGHFVTMVQVLFQVTMARMVADDPAGVERHGGELAELATRHEGVYWNSHASLLLGWAAARRGCVEQGLAAMEEGAAQRERMQGRAWAPQYLTQTAELLLAAGRAAEALRRLDEADAIVAATDQRVSEAETLRQRAAALHRLGAPALDVETMLLRALGIARTRRQALFEARLTADLAALKQRGA
jgi:class 3 adenylate cyclase/predicted ATPase